MKKKTISALLALTLLTGTSFTALADPLTDTQKQQIEQNKEKLNEVNSKITDLTNKIDALDSKISTLVIKIQQNENKIKEVEKEITIVEKSIDEAQKDLDEKQASFGQRMRAIYKSGGNGSYVSILFSSTSLSDLIDKVQACGKVMKLDKQQLKEIEDAKKNLDDKKKDLQNKEDEINKINEENKSKLKEFNELKEQQEKQVKELKAEKEKVSGDLADSEMPLIEYPISIVKNSSSSISELRNAIQMLRDARTHITSEKVDKIAVDYIEKAKDMVESKKAAQSSASSSSSSSVNRGNSGAVVASGSASGVLGYGYNFIGKPYVWGATGPDSFDCSGFTSYVYRNAAGIEIGRTTYDQMGRGKAVSYNELQPGDLVFTNGGAHVGIYAGGGNMLHAPRTGETVKVGPIYHFSSARRIIG